MPPLIIQLISGAVGGNIAGAILKQFNLGPIGNSIAGLIGGESAVISSACSPPVGLLPQLALSLEAPAPMSLRFFQVLAALAAPSSCWSWV